MIRNPGARFDFYLTSLSIPASVRSSMPLPASSAPLIGVVKNFVDLWSKFKELKTSRDSHRLLLDLSPPNDKRRYDYVEKVYKTLETSKPIADEISQNIRRPYLFVALLMFIIWFIIPKILIALSSTIATASNISIQTVTMLIILFAIILSFISGRFASSLLFKLDFPKFANSLWSGIKNAIDIVKKQGETFRSTFLLRISKPEEEFLDNYLWVWTMLRNLEVSFLAQNLGDVERNLSKVYPEYVLDKAVNIGENPQEEKGGGLPGNPGRPRQDSFFGRLYRLWRRPHHGQ
jgi:hypothetical protein